MKFRFKSLAAVAVIGVSAMTAVACSSGSTGSGSVANSAASSEASSQGQDSTNLIGNQPVPVYQFSQARQTMINAQDIEANGENTTTFGLSNTGSLVWNCSSIGMPVPAAAQLTNPSQQVVAPDGGGYQENNGDNVIPQMDPFGLYTGDTTGTYTLCVDAKGNQYLQYWEGLTDSVSGPASFVGGHVVMQGTPIKIKTKQDNPASPTPVTSPNGSATNGDTTNG